MRGQDVSAQAQYVANMPHTRKSRIPVEHLPLGEPIIGKFGRPARSRRIESGVCGWIYLVGGPVSPAIRGSAACVAIWRGLFGGGLPGPWALRLNWLLGRPPTMSSTGVC